MFKDFDEGPVAPGNFRNGGFARCLSSSKINERIPKIRPADSEANEAFDASCGRQPLAHFFVVLATSKNNTANFVPLTAMCCGHDRLAVLMAIESLDLPDIRLNPGVLQLSNRLNHQLRTKLQIIGFLVAVDPFELRLFRGDEQFK